jgi:hypothetical protein
MDPRSFVSLDGKLYLKGKDLSAMRERVFKRDGRQCIDRAPRYAFSTCSGPLQLSHRIRKSSGSTPENSLGSDDFKNLCVRCALHHRLYDGKGQPMHF